ncbi:hypothetical protein MXD81_55360, partial [Microbacteriaceae bacterium K1510]|nr:hypothetical protein [Microbacteriaceae bacterium K1510]
STELTLFASVGTELAHQDDVKRYVEKMAAAGSMRLEWCFLVEEDQQPVGRVAFWTLPKLENPLDLVLLELPWESPKLLSLGAALMESVLKQMLTLGAEEVGYVLDAPPSAPQWQLFTENRMQLLHHNGFTAARETFRFERTTLEQSPGKTSDFQFRTLPQVGEAAFIDAIARVSESTFDQRIREGREQNGSEAEANTMYRDLQQMEYEPDWWQLAYDSSEELVGLVMPAKSPTFATIGYIGVVPEKRGRGYIDVLLHHGTSLLVEAGEKMIRADTD